MAVVLVADDLELVRTLCQSILARHGHQTIEATNGAEAVKLYEEKKPDAVILDLRMPGMDGIATLKEIRKLDPQARVAMFTAHHERDLVMQAMEAGARDYVTKPFHADRFMLAVERLLA